MVGSRLDEHRGALSLSYPIEHGVVQNWADMELLWRNLYSREGLNVPSEEHAVSAIQINMSELPIYYFSYLF